MRAKVLNAAVLVLLGSLIGGGTWAVAQGLITSRDIQNRSIAGRDLRQGAVTSREIRDLGIRNRDIRRGVITINRLTPRVRNLIRQGGPQGPAGAPGAPGQRGEPGEPGRPGTPTLTSGDFGVIDRAVFGSPVAQLRSGPSDPPAGSGSLGLLVAGAPNYTAEKIAYGIAESGRLSRLNRVGFAVFTTPANSTRGGQSSNMPNIQFEIDPQISDAGGAITFSTLTFNAANTEGNAWTTIDATDPDDGRWSLTGRAGTATGCVTVEATSGCTFEQIKDRLPDARIFSAMINKGRDFEWQGAVDALRVNERIADFEEGGVIIEAA
jgi:hypothetical protein